ncbi:unnamed protein product [Gongylonema pulchrum]|uniref:RYYR-CCHC domain-containing protein n=1 Tax=Gongylonema pulchrum TaxID=637853 RepID=A0A3P7N1E7_9BILA|nr:unnamed protein product [Gongylonema pulchrum]
MGDLEPEQITQIQQAYVEATKDAPADSAREAPVILNVPMIKKFNPEDNFSKEDKRRCAFLTELITGQQPLVLHPFVLLLNRRFRWTDIAVPITGTEKFRIYRLNQSRNDRSYYRCSGCEAMAKEPEDPIAQIKVAEG